MNGVQNGGKKVFAMANTFLCGKAAGLGQKTEPQAKSLANLAREVFAMANTFDQEFSLDGGMCDWPAE
jgi:hypothetical protein